MEIETLDTETLIQDQNYKVYSETLTYLDGTIRQYYVVSGLDRMGEEFEIKAESLIEATHLFTLLQEIKKGR